jgi:hypothetical protein
VIRTLSRRKKMNKELDAIQKAHLEEIKWLKEKFEIIQKGYLLLEHDLKQMTHHVLNTSNADYVKGFATGLRDKYEFDKPKAEPNGNS